MMAARLSGAIAKDMAKNSRASLKNPRLARRLPVLFNILVTVASVFLNFVQFPEGFLVFVFFEVTLGTHDVVFQENQAGSIFP